MSDPVRDALAELVRCEDEMEVSDITWHAAFAAARAALAAQPAEPLTDEQIDALHAKEWGNWYNEAEKVRAVVRAVERAHGIAPQGE